METACILRLLPVFTIPSGGVAQEVRIFLSINLVQKWVPIQMVLASAHKIERSLLRALP